MTCILLLVGITTQLGGLETFTLIRITLSQSICGMARSGNRRRAKLNELGLNGSLTKQGSMRYLAIQPNGQKLLFCCKPELITHDGFGPIPFPFYRRTPDAIEIEPPSAQKFEDLTIANLIETQQTIN